MLEAPDRRLPRAQPVLVGEDGAMAAPGTPEGPGTAGEERRAPADPSALSHHVLTVTLWAGALTGAFLRAWMLFHVALNSDEAVVGLDAKAIAAGHFTAFYPGQAYGGAEPYVTAVLFDIFGPHAWAVKATALLLGAAAGVLTWRVALRLVRDRLLAAAAAVLCWVGPLASVYQSTVERGFRGVVLVCGLGALLAALRLLDGQRRLPSAVVLGLLAGVGWWASPEIVYYLLPTGLVVIGAVVAHPGAARWVRDLCAAAVAAAVGALPWLWDNVTSGFPSLQTKSFTGASSSLNHGYGDRFVIFFHHSLPMELGIVQPISGSSQFPGLPGGLLHDVLLAAVVGALALSVRRGGRALAMGAGLVAFPFLYALQPGTWFWQDGRYAVLVSPLLALVLVTGLDEAGAWVACTRWRVGRRARSGARLAGALAVAGSAALSVVVLGSAAMWFDPAQPRLLSGWTNPEAPTEQAVLALERQGVRDGYADYWVAYDLDFLSGGRLQVSVLPPDQIRDRAADQAARSSRQPAYLFVPPRAEEAAWWQFGETTAVYGPLGVTEHQFTSALSARGIPYRRVGAGELDAVVPASPARSLALSLAGSPAA